MATSKIELQQTLRKAARSKPPLEHVVTVLSDFKSQGGTRTEALEILEGLRTEFQDDDDSEDYILEMMDIAAGFCAPRFRVWHDS
jgi:hypothetical protein